MPRRFYDFDARYERDLEREPTYTGRRPTYRNATEQREQANERIALTFGRSFVDDGTGGDE